MDVVWRNLIINQDHDSQEVSVVQIILTFQSLELVELSCGTRWTEQFIQLFNPDLGSCSDSEQKQFLLLYLGKCCSLHFSTHHQLPLLSYLPSQQSPEHSHDSESIQSQIETDKWKETIKC